MVTPEATQVPRGWATTYGHVGFWGLCCLQSHADLGDLHCHMAAWCHQGPGFCHWSCLCLLSSSSQGLGWCLWLLLPPGDVQLSRVWTATWDPFDVWEPWGHWGYTDQGGLCSHWGQEDFQANLLLWPCLGLWSCYHWYLYNTRSSEPYMLNSEGCAEQVPPFIALG